MKIQNQVCTFAQAKTLCQLGIIQKGAFTWLFDPLNSRHDISAKSPEELSLLRASHPNSKEWACREMNEWFSAFTVAELGVMLPEWIKDETLRLEQWATDAPKRGIQYRKTPGDFDPLDTPSAAIFMRTEAQARAAMLIYLLENGHVTPESCNSLLLNS